MGKAAAPVPEAGYRLERVLARSSAGLLHAASVPGQAGRWVLKECAPEEVPSLEDAVRRLGGLTLARVASAREVVELDGARYLVREYVDGLPLSAVAHLPRKPREALEVLGEALLVVEDLLRMREAGLPLPDRMLAPEHLVLDAEERVRPVNPLPVRRGSPDGAEARLCAGVADLVQALLAPPERPQDLPPEVAWFTSRCRGVAGSPGYQRLDQVEASLRELLPKPPEPEPEAAPPRSRRPALLLALGVCFLGLAGFVASPGATALPHRLAAVALPEELAFFDAESLQRVAGLSSPPARAVLDLGRGLLGEGRANGLALVRPGASEEIPVPVPGGVVSSLARDPDGRWLAVAAQSQGVVSVRRLAGLGAPGRRHPGPVFSTVGNGVRSLLGKARGQAAPPLFVAEPERGTLTRYDLDPPALAAEASLPGLGAVALSPGGKHLYVALPARREVRILDPVTLQQTDRKVQFPSRPEILVASGEWLWVGNDAGTWIALDPSTLKVQGRMVVGGTPVAAVAAERGRLWVAATGPGGGVLSLMDTARRQVVARAALAGRPLDLTVLFTVQGDIVRSDDTASSP